ncbi:MAG: efflux RND transporter permease subunit [Deltaproteobacteria bacterium]|nr:efflux RND transporter permease subunit [Deltaproteobacteria bacterium]MBN2670121.1 efflux RND transporter permease subunit [Deltaproteobacteria bacterium]
MSSPLISILQKVLTQRIMTLFLAAIVMGLGIWSYRQLPIDAFPDISTPQVQVIVKAPGMSPQEVEQRVTYPIETEVRGIPRQTVLRSVTKYALSVITIDFEENVDTYWARQQVSERIGQVLSGLPEGVEGGLAPITTPLSDVYMFVLEGKDYSNRKLREILDWQIRPRLLSVDGVADVNSLGGEVQSFQVELKPDALLSYGLSIAEVAEAVKNNNDNAGGDRFVQNDEVILVRSVGRLKTMDDIGNITVATRNSEPILLKKVADVKEGALVRYGGVTRNGKGEGVQGVVLNRRGANGRATVAAVKEALQNIEKSLPKGVKIKPFYDRSQLIEAAVSNVEWSLMAAVGLVLVVLFIFLGNIRSAVTTGMILPLTVLATFGVMAQVGITANLMSLGGLAIAIGILVDSAVVMVENIHSKIAVKPEGVSALHLVYTAAAEVAAPIVIGVIIIVVSLMPIATLTGLEGKLFAPLAVTVAIAVLSSLVLSLTVIPVISTLLMKNISDRESAFFRLGLRLYRPTIRFALTHKKLLFSLAGAALVATVGVFFLIGREFLPYLDEGTIVVQTEKLPTISLERSMEGDTRVQQALMTLPEITGMVSRVGSDELRLDPMGFNETDAFLVTRPRSEWKAQSVQELHDKMRAVLDDIPGLEYGFTQPIDMRVSEMLTGVRAAVAVKLYGDDLEKLDDLAQHIEAILEKVPGSVDILRSKLTGQKYLNIDMRYDVMARLGITAGDVNRLVATALGGEVVSDVTQGNRRIPILVRYPESNRNSKAAIGNILVDAPSGNKIRLAELTRITEVDGPVQIKRENGKRQVVIQVNVQGRDVVGFVDEVKQKVQQQVALPPGYFVDYGGQFENQQRASAHLALVIPLTIFVILLILFLTFHSLRQALIILFNIPLAMIGGVFALFMTGLYLSVPASLGFIALLGIAVENGVVMLSFFNQLRERGMSLETAVIEGSEKRLRPILMTSLLTILGLVPLLLSTGPGSEIQKPLAVVVVGGVFTSTALTLVLLPVFYAWIERWAAKRAAAHRPGMIRHSIAPRSAATATATDEQPDSPDSPDSNEVSK